MNISLITSEESFLNNYGAVLQGYAMTQVLTAMGCKVKIIRYRGCNPNAFSLYRSTRRWFGRVYIKGLKSFIQHKHRYGLKKQRTYFSDFQREYLTFWNKKRIEWQQLRKHFPQSDAYLCGSDQIWNPYYKSGYNDPGYFLDFVPPGKRRIAYAPSFGCDDIPKTAQTDLKCYLDKFDAISIREPEGVEIIWKYTGIKVPVVADPTFLLSRNEWDKIVRVPNGIPPKYILCYRFMKNDVMTECMKILSNILRLPVITLPLSKIALEDNFEKVFEAGPREFVGLVKNATLVCTDSFHATAFSLIMNTPFYTFLDRDEAGYGRNMNSRIRNVIGIAALEDRVIGHKADIQQNKILAIDFSDFNREIAKFRESSIQWLNNALPEVNR